MQLIDTRVGDASDGMITVEFRGEGGELVSVKMTAADDLRGEAAINRAKALMVQLTRFAEDYNPSQDERSESGGDGEGPGWERTQTKSEVPVASTFGDAPPSAT